MSTLNIKDILGGVLDCLELQVRSSKDWHFGDPVYETDEIPQVEGVNGLRELVMRQHWVIFRIHQEEEERAREYKLASLEAKRKAIIEVIDAHLGELLSSMNISCSDLCFGVAMEAMSGLGLETYHRREQAEAAVHKAAHHPDDAQLARKAERLLEKLGELDTQRIVQGREILDALMAHV